MKISNAKLIELHRGLAALDAGHEVTVDGKSTKRPYKYGALVHGPIGFNAIAIKPLVDAFQKANVALFNSFGTEAFTDAKGEPARRVPPSDEAAYRKQLEAMMEQTHEVKIYRVKMTELKRGTEDGQNPIPAHVLADLRLILTDDLPKDQFEEAKDEPAAEAKA